MNWFHNNKMRLFSPLYFEETDRILFLNGVEGSDFIGGGEISINLVLNLIYLLNLPAVGGSAVKNVFYPSKVFLCLCL